jgi:hypothetical protein
MDRHLTYHYGTPLVVGCVIWMLAISEWTAAAVISSLFFACLYAGVRTEGTIPARLAARFRRADPESRES